MGLDFNEVKKHVYQNEIEKVIKFHISLIFLFKAIGAIS